MTIDPGSTTSTAQTEENPRTCFPKYQVCLCLASADPTITTALFSRLCSPSGSGGDGGVQSLARDVEHGVGIPSSIGDAVLKRAGETGCLTDQSVLELLRWCVPRCLFLNEAPLTVTDSLLVR